MAYLASLRSILFLKEFQLLLDQFYQLDPLLGYFIHVLSARYVFGNLVSHEKMDKNFILTFLVILSQGRMDRNLTLRNESLFFLVNKTRSYCITWPPRPYSIVNRTRSYCFSLPLRLYCIIDISLVHGEEYIRKFSHILYLAWYKSGQLWRPLLNLVLCL